MLEAKLREKCETSLTLVRSCMITDLTENARLLLR